MLSRLTYKNRKNEKCGDSLPYFKIAVSRPGPTSSEKNSSNFFGQGQTCFRYHPGDACLNIFIDTSALAKRYVQEPGSEELEDLFLRATSSIFVSTLAYPEFSAAIGRKLRNRELEKDDAAIAISEFETDWNGLFETVSVTKPLAESAASIAVQYGLKGADAIHLATPLASGGDLFVVSDVQLFRAAEEIGIRTYNPVSGPL